MRKLILLSYLTATGMLAAPIHPLNEMSPIADGFNSGGVPNYVRGWRFRANNNVTVTELGAFTPHGQGSAFTINLWNAATTALLGQVTIVSAGDNNWEWENLTTPVNLLSGSQYIVSIYSSASPYYFRDVSAVPAWMPAGTIQYLDMRYANAANVNTFPTQVLSNFQYGVPDIGYQLTSSLVPEPSTGALVVLSGALIALVRRRANGR
ncbi:MAG: DUF4082 domain-containing protein [Bryobacterales bacterium]|nr:DUF4082 domain-containing protein [Bryobacterales bacterium]